MNRNWISTSSLKFWIMWFSDIFLEETGGSDFAQTSKFLHISRMAFTNLSPSNPASFQIRMVCSADACVMLWIRFAGVVSWSGCSGGIFSSMILVVGMMGRFGSSLSYQQLNCPTGNFVASVAVLRLVVYLLTVSGGTTYLWWSTAWYPLRPWAGNYLP